MKENKYLKWLLIVQSFLPLFFLLLLDATIRSGAK